MHYNNYIFQRVDSPFFTTAPTLERRSNHTLRDFLLIRNGHVLYQDAARSIRNRRPLYSLPYLHEHALHASRFNGAVDRGHTQKIDSRVRTTAFEMRRALVHLTLLTLRWKRATITPFLSARSPKVACRTRANE